MNHIIELQKREIPPCTLNELAAGVVFRDIVSGRIYLRGANRVYLGQIVIRCHVWSGHGFALFEAEQFNRDRLVQPLEVEFNHL